MPDIFISYAREDWAIADLLASQLQRCGYDVWWDKDLIAGQGTFREELAAKLDEVKAVIVIWSVDSANSEWVRQEADHAKHYRKLISTRVPDLDFMQIPIGFREEQTEYVSNLEKILLALKARGLVPAAGSGEASGADYASKVAVLLKEQGKEDAQVGPVLPLVVLMAGMILGICAVVASMLIGVGWVHWDPVSVEGVPWQGPKQVGYVAAINWSLTTVLIVPMTMALILLARQVMIAARSQMVVRRMMVSQDFDPVPQDDGRVLKMRRAIHRVINGSIGVVTTLIVSFSLLDYFTVVDRIYHDPEVRQRINIIHPTDGYGLDDVTMERDWSLAAHLRRSDGSTTNPTLNRIFALFVYVVFAGFSVGILFSFFIAVFGVGMFFMPEVARQYGLLVIPDLESRDRRFGFEILAPFFSVTLSISVLCLILAYLMTLQNIYLRVPDRNLFEFLTPHPGAAAQLWREGNVGEAINALVGHVGYVPGNSLQSILAWFIAAFMFIAILGVAYLFLRASAMQGRAKVITEFERYGTARLRRVTGLPIEEIVERLRTMRTWPLVWPGLNATMAGTFLIISAFVFYKFGIVIMGLGLAFVIHNTFQLFRS